MTAERRHPAAHDPRLLTGVWRLRRTIDDRLARDVKTVDGTLTLAPAGPGRLRWSERGTLHLGGGPDGARGLPVERTLYVVRADVVRETAEAPWTVVFEDGHAFHPWAPGRRLEHPCRADLYTGRIDVPSSGDAVPRAWAVHWEVAGPEKDYTMATRLDRAD